MNAAILLATCEPARAAAYQDALRDAGPWQTLAPVHQLADAQAVLMRRAPDLLVADLQLAKGQTVNVVKLLSSAVRRSGWSGRMQILLVADNDSDPALLLQALRAGADSVYTASTHSALALRQQVRETLDGGARMDPWIAQRLLDHYSPQLIGGTDLTVDALSDPLALTPAERSLLRRLAAGDRMVDLARQQGVGPQEITCRVRQLYRKMQLAQHASGLTLA